MGQGYTEVILSALSSAWHTISNSSGSVPSILVILITLIVLDFSRRSIAMLSVLSLPGTIAHELTHLAVGIVLIAKPARFSIIPQRVGNLYYLGSVSFHGLNIFNGVFVCLAPLFLLPLATMMLGSAVLPAWDEGRHGAWFAYAVLAGNLVFSARPSIQDIKVGMPSALFYSAIAAMLYHFN